ncbi:MAG: DEAD/DEAH box helicase [Thiohalomonadaceae bacterium]
MFAPAVDAWFRAAHAAPTAAQARGWPVIAQGRHALIVAPTGSGKTLAAFLYAIDRCMQLPREAPAGVRVLYVSPLKALVYDVERNLRAPLAGIQVAGERLGTPLRTLRVDVRTGDTPAQARRMQARHPGEILVTTPESLFLLLGSAARATLRTVHTVIVDEVHALLPTKRGVHLALSLERLAEITESEPQRIGLSATVRPLSEAAGFLGGDRAVEIVDASAPPALDLTVTVPVPDMEKVVAGSFDPAAPPPAERGLWMAMYPALLAEIRSHRSTLVFVNSRGLCERLTARLNELAGEELVRAHHGSVSHEQRAAIEEDLKQGRLRGIVATSSLELGIDMGAVDLVLQIESPGAVARGLQRVGRAGHAVGEISVGRIYPKFRADLLECAVVAERMRRGAIESVATPVNALDVLAQQVVAMCADTPRRRADIAALVRRAWPYRTLTQAALDAVLTMLTGGYPSGEFADLRPLLAWDRARDIIEARRGTAMLSRLNVGTIPDRGLYTVQIGSDGPRLGELDEEMVFESKKGDVILLGASSWRIEEITRDRVHVSPAPGEGGRLPFWHGEGPGRPRELGLALGAFLRELAALPREARAAWLEQHLALDEFAAGNLAAYVNEQEAATGVLPSDRHIVVERFRDELGDWRVCILSPFGARIHGPWAMALQAVLAAREGYDVQLMHTDDGLVLRFADVDTLPSLAELLPPPDEAERLVTEQLPHTAMFATLFRENAARALLMPRRTGRGRRPLWAQRLKAQQLLATVQRHRDFPIVLETYRQALSDVFDLPGLKRLLADIRARRVQVHEVETHSASPFARSLVFAYVANYLYAGDVPMAERKAQALTLDRNLLAELLGQEELRELIDPQALAALEAELQHLAPERRARDADELHDLLRRLGDLSAAELGARSEHPEAIDVLLSQRRATRVELAGETRHIAMEDAALYRDALAVTPAHLPADAPVLEHPREALLRRYARSHGPFTTAQVARRYGLGLADTEAVLHGLRRQGVLVLGEIRPDGMEPEWCDAEVLRRLRRRTLARLRRSVAPVDARTLGRFLPDWQHLGEAAAGSEALRRVIVQLEGLALPWSLLGQVVLPARVPGFRFEDLDLLAATGEVVWVGAGALGARDGRVMILRREQAPRLLDPPPPLTTGDALQQAILDHLAARGACFLAELEMAAHARGLQPSLPELTEALWSLVWAGQVTNDTFAPLRALAGGAAQHPRRHGPSAVGGRWSRVADLHARPVSPTERAVARVEMLLERYGVVSREAALAENLPGGFGPLYQVLKEMEAAGRVRRGYFVEGLSGLQFARAGAVDRLRAGRAEEPPVQGYGEWDAMLLAVLDPANPYGTLLPWPATGAGTPRRVPGAWIVLVDGAPALYLSADGRQLLTFPEGWREEPSALTAAARLLHRLPRGARRRTLVIERIDGAPARESPLAPALLTAGFVPDYKGLSQL